MFKALVSLACVAVIAIAGLLFTQSREAAERRTQAAEYRECQDMLASIRSASITTAPSEQAAKKCMFRGYYTPDDLDRAVAAFKARQG